jgi:peptidoglycan/LPS O-acetylase OafA/YrhL
MSPSTQQNVRPYFPALDGVRAIAALMVMVCHFCQDEAMRGPWIIGQTGVDLFFVLSGFLITTILLLAPARDWHEVRTFYIRRVLRIFPLYYGVLIVLALCGSVASFWFWTYLQNIPLLFSMPVIGPAHFWSLAVEEQFYLVWPFLVFFLPRQWLTKALWAIVAMAVLFRILLLPLGIHWSIFVSFSRFDGLAAGGLLATYYRRGLLHTHRRGLLVMGAISASALWFEWWKFRGHGETWGQVVELSLTSSFYAAVVGYVVINGSAWFNGLLALKPLRFIGRVSYGLYVFHPFVFSYVLPRVHQLSSVVQLLACSGATLAVSTLSWYGYERWFIRLKGKLAPERETTQSLLIST